MYFLLTIMKPLTCLWKHVLLCHFSFSLRNSRLWQDTYCKLPLGTSHPSLSGECCLLVGRQMLGGGRMVLGSYLVVLRGGWVVLGVRLVSGRAVRWTRQEG